MRAGIAAAAADSGRGGAAAAAAIGARTVDDFVLPSEVVEVAGLLFDMDGTIIDSTAAVVRHWTRIAGEIGVDPNVILATSHGRRTIDTMRVVDPSKATWEYVHGVESIIPERYGSDAVEIPGARALLDDLNAASVPWTIVTSGSKPLVEGWFEALDLPRPPAKEETMVTAEDVEHGKPDPACYQLGKERLFSVTDDQNDGIQRGAEALRPILVLEDAPAGIKAGYDAGCRVVALATSHTLEQLVSTDAEWIVQDMRSVRLVGITADTGMIRIEISKALRR